MKILFIGCVDFSEAMLYKLIELKSNIVGVITKKKSNFNSDFQSLEPTCVEYSINHKLTEDINSNEIIEWSKNLMPDIIFCFGWSSLIKTEMLNLSPMGVLGYHPTKLPQNRGRHPLIWSLCLDLKISASTFFFMKEAADDGDILSQKSFIIEYEDNARILYDKVIKIALSQVEEFLPLLINKKYTLINQDHSKSNLWRKRNINDGKIDFRMTSKAIYNLVRALTKPYSGAHLVYKNKEVKIWEVKEKIFEDNNIESGKVLSSSDTVEVKTYDGSIILTKHDFIDLPKINEYL